MEHSDDDQVFFLYASSRNITFQNEYSPDESGYTWKEWNEMTDKEQEEALLEYLYELVEVWVDEG